ncbi:MAG: YbhB/YbcL family Raf kinase inhibitor-like protein [Gemmatimonadaceae bacterium]
MPTSASSFDTVSVRAPQAPSQGHAIKVTSSSITDGATIGMDFVFTGCGGKNESPQLSWTGAPAGTKSFAITCFDPDAPTGAGYWHWLAFDIPASVGALAAGAGTDKSPPGGKSATSDFGMASYGGPCPPKGDAPHRYIFTVYALDVPSLANANEKTSGATLVFHLRGHVLAVGTLTGTFGH